MDMYILALAEDGFTYAWQYQRTFPDKSEIRTRLMRKVLEWCFTRRSHCFKSETAGSLVIAKPRSEHLKQLIVFPLSSFEQSLLHAFALEPPASLPASSVPLLQDLVCVRLVQSGQYIDAIKLDQQFASTRLGRGTQASLAAERRRKMIEDVIAALPSIERQEIEEKLRAVGQRKPAALAKTAQNKTAAIDLDMSWEEIPPPPPRALPTTSNAPRFILGRPTYGHNQPRAAAVPMIEGPPVRRVGPSLAPAPTRASNGVVPPGLNGASHVRNFAPTVPLPSSQAGLRVGLFGPGPQASKPFLNSSGSGGHRSSPLFPSHAAREMRHTAVDQTVLYSQKPIPPEESRAETSSLQNYDLPDVETRSDNEDPHEEPPRAPEPMPVAEFSESVFSNSRPEPIPYPREATEPPLPGAFRVEREVAQSEQTLFAHSPPTPPTRQRPAKARRTARTSIPGGFDEGASGEEDNVPPLPAVSSAKRTTRRRVSRTNSIDAEEDNVPMRPRRSSRLSAASSSSDHSPQKTSAPKATRKTRTSAGSSATGMASSTRSSTRRRR